MTILFTQDGRPVSGSNPAPVALHGPNGQPLFGPARLAGDGLPLASGPDVLATLLGYDGAGLVPLRTNTGGTLLVGAARTATTASLSVVNHNARGVLVWLDVTGVGGSGSVTLRVVASNPTGGTGAILFEGAPVATTGLRLYVVYPGATGLGNNFAGVIGQPLPRVWNVQVIHADASAYAYAVGYSMVL